LQAKTEESRRLTFPSEFEDLAFVEEFTDSFNSLLNKEVRLVQPLFSLDGESLIIPQSVSNQFPSLYQDHETDLRSAEAEFALLISIAMQRFNAGKNSSDAVKWLISQLHDLRRKSGPSVWQKLIPLIQAHPSAKILQQCPFTRWSFEKPRGYSGDASLIDFI
jgi:hypothetical protein